MEALLGEGLMMEDGSDKSLGGHEATSILLISNNNQHCFIDGVSAGVMCETHYHRVQGDQREEVGGGGWVGVGRGCLRI